MEGQGPHRALGLAQAVKYLLIKSSEVLHFWRGFCGKEGGVFDGFATLGANATEIFWPQVSARVDLFKTAKLQSRVVKAPNPPLCDDHRCKRYTRVSHIDLTGQSTSRIPVPMSIYSGKK